MRNTVRLQLWSVVLVGAATVSFTGCSALQGLSKPQAQVTGVSIRDIDLQSATLVFNVEVTNPYSLPLPLANLDYSLASRGQTFLSGTAPLQGDVPASSKKVLLLPAKVAFARVLQVAREAHPGSVVPYAAQMTLSVKAPLVGDLSLPLKKEGKLPIPAMPEVSISEIQWQKVGLDEISGLVKLSIVNPNQFSLELSKMTYALWLGDTEVANNSLAKSLAIAQDGGAGTLEIPISFSPQKTGLAVLKMVTGSGSGYRLKGMIEVGTPMGPMSLPMDKVGKTSFRK